jgi:2'-5' RNA ligase
MELSGATVPGYRVYEYLLVLEPHEELRERILTTRKEFNKLYRNSAGMAARPHVLLAKFLQYEMLEERLLNRLRAVAMGFYPIKVELKEFGSFPSHTIFINVISRIPVQNLIRQVRTEAQRLMKLNDETKPHFIMEPHIAIARKLAPWQYEKGWLEYSHLHFSGKFIADQMLLLRRPVGELSYQVLARLQFQNLPVVTKQGDLFV